MKKLPEILFLIFACFACLCAYNFDKLASKYKSGLYLKVLKDYDYAQNKRINDLYWQVKNLKNPAITYKDLWRG